MSRRLAKALEDVLEASGPFELLGQGMAEQIVASEDLEGQEQAENILELHPDTRVTVQQPARVFVAMYTALTEARLELEAYEEKRKQYNKDRREARRANKEEFLGEEDLGLH